MTQPILYSWTRFIDADGKERVYRRCRHLQAEPVHFLTGEIAACICITCLEQLPADYIDKQRSRAYHNATCKHAATVDITGFGDSIPRYMCAYCGMELSGPY